MKEHIEKLKEINSRIQICNLRTDPINKICNLFLEFYNYYNNNLSSIKNKDIEDLRESLNYGMDPDYRNEPYEKDLNFQAEISRIHPFQLTSRVINRLQTISNEEE